MTVISTDKSVQDLNFTIVAEFDATVERVWRIWEDPRKLERWWGPPTWPATFEQLDFVEGGKAHYYMTGPDGDKARGWWRITSIDAPRRLAFDDGFADDNWDPIENLGVTKMTVALEERDGRTRMTTVSTFENADQMQKLIEMGMDEGMGLAMGQIDAILAE
ncbi:SRPBCC domain-containing protein [Rhodococcus sp. BP-252]|uniref:Polyketide cyclase n=1 Tax=Rhodococcoides kyotonense TaxID=398843 RepID=A0A177YEH9_9NOCA|nr:MULTISPECIES: SRPBCC domain-containing protein [Rhodococcus]MBY6414095.1 SRPBCC domain-containing protein [Rhodococcus sp. BP-320]MBY6418866.1 SRPBCC domain-containing protein [Rhodococcus sp. BP-321]MBY6423389.1 SRPBCC domain-containing protein [Rhodococcus sp. BP-324]MBY6428843.1 SRPBCC domain-containing protein [Rhodococcus sp. BP-323]MBY6433849.1 SRPBCC domain-containing protein [Rhodococcus sp. BP-322]